jgi:hypothetical protein
VTEQDDRRDRAQQFYAAALKVLLVAVAIGGAIGLGTFVVVNALGLDDTTDGNQGPVVTSPVTPLPTTALPVPTELPEEPTPSGLVTGSPTDPASGELFLAASPQQVNPMERINLTGRWPGHDAVGLMVQRLEDGEWVDFGVQTQVSVGTFKTYVQTGREGDNVFRVFDPNTNTASNEVTVTIE